MTEMKEVSIHWQKDGKRIMTVGSGKNVTKIVNGSVKIKKDYDGRNKKSGTKEGGKKTK